MTKLEQTIGYSFKDKSLLETALTHTSFANESKRVCKNNERLEFLGDSVLSVVISEYLFKENSDLPEGELSRIRASLVCEPALAEFARQIHLGDELRLGKGEDLGGGRNRASILSDAFEALIAALYLDSGIERVRTFILPFIKQEGAQAEEDYKTRLQEVIQQNPDERIRYVLAKEEGPDHDKQFTVEVRLNSNCLGKGTGHSKKQAEQYAAKQALIIMGLEPPSQ